MSTIPDRKTLSSLRRADLQKLCKERGLRANMRSGDLINLLLDIAHGEEGRRPPSRASSMRVVSRAGSVSSTRSRAGSVIVHDFIEESAEDGEPQSSSSSSTNPNNERVQQPQAGPSTRRKAKETQFKLGVGRPAIIGGTGARASSSMNKPRSTRGRAAVVAQPSEAAIQEEEEDPVPFTRTSEGASLTTQSPNPQTSAFITPNLASSSNANEFRDYVSGLVEPLKAQIGALQADLERAKRDAEDVHSLRSSISELTSQLAALQGRDQDKTRLLESLREELAALKLAHVPEDSYPKPDGHNASHNQSHAQGTSGEDLLQSSNPSKSSLGKRRRDAAVESVVSGGGGMNNNRQSGPHGSLPSRKKAKVDSPEGESQELGNLEVDAMDTTETVSRPFTIFSGPEERSEVHEGPPPSVRTSEMFTFPAVTPPNGTTPFVSTSTSQGLENRAPSTGNAFSFNFATSIFRPMTSTPTVRPSTALPPPEPPTSPSPAGPGISALPYPPGSRSRPASRPTSRAAPSQASVGIAPITTPVAGPSTAQVTSNGPLTSASSIQTPSLAAIAEEMNVNAEGAMYANPMRVGSLGVGLPGIVPLPMPPDTPDQPMKRTMYGTELEGDSRFGDFGVEGVAMGFWTGAAPRF